MSDPFKNPEAIREYLRERMQASSSQRSDLAETTGISDCYYEGYQQIYSTEGSRFVNSTVGRLLRNINPDSNKLRVTRNELTARVIKAIAATYPSQIDVTIDPPVRDQGVDAEVVSQCLEDAAQALVKKYGFLRCARRANVRRAQVGDYGIVMHMQSVPRQLSVGSFVDRQIRFYTFHPLRLILDPACDERDLRDHHEVIWHDVWTVHDLKFFFPGVQWEEDQMRTVGELTPFEQGVSELSGGKLFNRYKVYASTKGARVFQIHRKDETGRFGTMWNVVEARVKGQKGTDELYCPNFDNPVSPFGGDGLPMVMLRGHHRTSSPNSISDVSMAKDPQDIVNLMWTYLIRGARNNSGFQWLVDRAAMGAKQNEDVRSRFTNKDGAIIEYNTLGNRQANPPQIVTSPPMQAWIMDVAKEASEALRKQTFRTEQDSGEGVKSHVPYQTTAAFKKNSDQVLGIRVDEDRTAYAQILNVALGTVVGNVQDQSPSTIRMLQDEGFGEDDLATLLAVDRHYPTCNLVIEESSIRYRSSDERRDDLLGLANSTNPAVSAGTLRKGFADLDMAANNDDEEFDRAIKKAVRDVVNGQEWVPAPLGDPYTEWALTELRKAFYDKKARKDPSIKERVQRAIAIQQQVYLQEQIQTNPELAIQAQAQQQQAQQAQMQAQAQAEEEAPPATVGEMLDMMAQGGAAA